MHTVSINIDRHHRREMWCGCEFVTQCARLEARRLSGDGTDTAGMVAAAVMRPVAAGLSTVTAG